MNELRFRELMIETVGDEPAPPWLAAHVRARVLAPRARAVPRNLIVAVAVLAIVLVGAVGLNGLSRRPMPITGPAATPSAAPTPSPVAIDPGNCSLPVFVERGSGPPSRSSIQAGFVDTKTGRYTRDPSALTTNLPRSDGSTVGQWSITYSAAVHQWLPTGTDALAPDGLSYAWIRTLPVGVPYPRYTSSELHRYDVASATDHLVWTFKGGFAIQGWGPSGILVDAGPLGSSASSWWVIDPVTGAAIKHAAPNIPFPPFKPLPGDPKRLQYNQIGRTAEGYTVFYIGDRDFGGSLEWVFYETAPGQRVTIYRSNDRNAVGFIPDMLMVDTTGIWFATNTNHTIWHWQVGQKLQKVALAGLPPLLAGANSYVFVSPTGACF